MNTFFSWMIRLRYALLAGGVVLFFFFGYHMHFVGFESSAKIEHVLGHDDPVLQEYRDTGDTFLGSGEGEKLFVAFGTGSIYSSSFLSFLHDTVSKISELEGVLSTTDLFSAYSIHGNSSDLTIDPYIEADDLPLSENELHAKQQQIEEDPFAPGRLVNTAGTSTVVTVEMGADCDREAVVNSIKNLVFIRAAEYRKSSGDALSVHYAGNTVIEQAISEAQKKEDFIFTLMVGCLVVVLFLLFRSIPGILIPCGVMMISVTTTIALKELAGSPMSTIDPMLYALITTISISDSIHFVSVWYNPRILPELSGRLRILAVMKHSFFPCFLTSATTAVGFAALGVTRIPQTRSFGLFAAAGVMCAFAYSVVLVPGMLYILRPLSRQIPLPFQNGRGRFSTYVSGFSAGLSAWIHKRKKAIVLGFVCASVFSCAMILRIQSGTNPYSFLKDNHTVNRDLAFFEQSFSGIHSVDVVLSTDNSGHFKQLAVLNDTDRLIAGIKKLDGVIRTDSFIPLVKQMNRAMNDDEAVSYRLPETDQGVAQYLLLYEMSDDVNTLYTWANSDYSSIRIRLYTETAADINFLKRKIGELFGSTGFADEVACTISGDAVLWGHVDHIFISGQMLSLVLAIGVISLILFLMFRSLRLGLYSIGVNLFPILFGLGIMGLGGIHLSMGTVMIASIAIGIAVDDTIHFVFRFQKEYSPDRPFTEILERVNSSLLRPIVFTSLILALGFFSNTLSSFKPNAYFGLIAGIVILVTMASDVLFMPALIGMFGYKKGDRGKLRE